MKDFKLGDSTFVLVNRDGSEVQLKVKVPGKDSGLVEGQIKKISSSKLASLLRVQAIKDGK